MGNTHNHFDPISITYAPMEASYLLAQELMVGREEDWLVMNDKWRLFHTYSYV